MSLPFFSVIIPTHGRPQLLKRAIQSVQASSFRDVEIIVVSDESNAETFSVVANALGPTDVFVKRHGPAGPASSRNIGLSHARGERIIFLDDDDTFLPDYFEKAVQFCERNAAQVLYSNFRVCEENREDLSAPTRHNDTYQGNQPVEDCYVRNFIPNHTCLYPHKSLKNKLQDPYLRSLEDWDFLLNVMSDSTFQHIDILGAVVHKDFVNPGNRRGTSTEARDSRALFDCIYVYRRWPSPTEEIRIKRRDLMRKAGLELPLEWL